MAVNCHFGVSDVISAPCLLDDLMDNQIIKCDFDFGSTLAQVGTFPTKGSPSHESDSGVSEMSDVRSVSPLSVGGIESPNLFDFEAFTSSVLDDDVDDELAGYFTKSHDGNNNKEFRFDSLTQTNCNLINLPVAESSTAEIPDSDVDSVEDSNESDPDYFTYVKPVQTGKTCSSPAEDIRILNPQSVKFPACDGQKRKTPAVKVVKVVKTPATSTKDYIHRQVVEALDNRNKQNAVQAKLNREKKKAYIKQLEDDMESMKMENFALKEMSRKALREKTALREEVDYLKNVLANHSALSGLLKNIGNTENVKLSSSFMHKKRSTDHDHDYESRNKRVKIESSTSVKSASSAGICLHVDQGSVSLEFCSKCSSMDKSSSDAD